MLVLSICLMWLSWRRYAHAHRELNARRIAEQGLGEVLAENRELAQQNLRIQEAERKHLARELHDELGQYLNAIKLDAVSICESGGALDPCGRFDRTHRRPCARRGERHDRALAARGTR